MIDEKLNEKSRVALPLIRHLSAEVDELAKKLNVGESPDVIMSNWDDFRDKHQDFFDLVCVCEGFAGKFQEEQDFADDLYKDFDRENEKQILADFAREEQEGQNDTTRNRNTI